MGDALKFLFYLAILGIICAVSAVCYGGYTVVDYFFLEDTTVIESKTIVKPDYRLETNGKEIDTVYIYKFE